MRLRQQVIFSIFKRNVASYFSGILGYLFIVVFVVIGGTLAFNAQFFTANEPNLDQLSEWYPLLLLFFIPAVTMSVWADERKMGTDELLFTLPATEIEILLGKYLAVLAVYTVALAFSKAHMLVLMWLGNPDWGLLATTYFGYWFAGAALLSAGMLASILTQNMSVAFVLGILLCGVPVFIGQVGSMVGLGDVLKPFSLEEQFRDFSMGVIPLNALLYFFGLTALMLYLNLILMTKRHWSGNRERALGWQYAIRAVSVAVVLSCATAWAGYSAFRVDATYEQLFSLSDATHSILDKLDSERPIEIQAFISPEVPSEYVDTRKRLMGLLRQFDEIGGKNLEVRYVDVEPFSKQAEEAEKFGIDPVPVLAEEDGRRNEVDLYLGAVVISSYDKVVVPFFGKGLPIEYELTRSIQTVATEDRYRVGILNTDAELMGGQEWQIVTELKKQYDVEAVSPDAPIEGDNFDVLLAAMPSSLTGPQMDHLVDYVTSGRPVIIFDDPFPPAFSRGGFGVAGAPRQPKPNPQAGMMGGGSPPPPQKADGGRATRLLEALEINWPYDGVVFDVNNPHPEFAMLPPEYVFVTSTTDSLDAFNASSQITEDLEELIAIYPGAISPRGSGAGAIAPQGSGNVEFTSLLKTGPESGFLRWNEFVDEGGINFFTMQQTATPLRNPLRTIDSQQYTLAARLKSDSVNAIFVADIDMISDFFFQERNLGNLSMKFDNVTFVLNAVDSLVGDDAYIKLRSRRKKHRTLKRVEAQKRDFLKAANQAELEADKEADDELKLRKEQLSQRVQEIKENEDLDPLAKSQLMQQAQTAEQQRLSLAEAQIEQKKNDDIRRIRAQTNEQIRSLEAGIRLWAVWLPAIPAIAIGLIVFVIRKQNERSTVSAQRRRSHR